MNDAVTGCPTYDRSALKDSTGGITPEVTIEGDPELAGVCGAVRRVVRAILGSYQKRGKGEVGERYTSGVETSLASVGSFDNPEEEGLASLGPGMVREFRGGSSGSECR